MTAMARLMMLLRVLWVGVAVSTAVPLQKRIIGGRPCERRYHVKLRAAASGGASKLCGGSLISDRWILTAAHCWERGRTVFADLPAHPEGPVQITAEPVIYADKKDRTHDIMLLQLPLPSNVQPVALPDCEYRPEIVEVAGHAATSGKPSGERAPSESPALHCADMKVVSCDDLNKTVQELFPNAYKSKVYQHWFCSQTPGKDICFGDSGGGAVDKDKIYGVISFVGDPRNVCRTAAAFMDLCNPEYASWIRETIG